MRGLCAVASTSHALIESVHVHDMMKRRFVALAAFAGLSSAGGYWAWKKWLQSEKEDSRPDELAATAAALALIQPAAPATRLLGWNINWVEQSRLRRDIPKIWEKFKQLGANTTRDAYEWAWVQNGKNSPFIKDRYVKPGEDLIRSEYKAASMQSLRLLCYGNVAFWTGEKMPTADQFTRFANGFAAYATHVADDQPDARIFEVWNEWNLTTHFNGNEEIRRGPTYARLFIHAAAAIHRKRPDAKVITQGLAVSKETNGLPDNEFLVRTLNHPGVLQSADGIGLHPYFFKLNGSPERLMNYLAFTRQQLLREVKGYDQRTLPFYITETGFPTAEKSGLSIGSRWGYGIDETLQAAFLARIAILCMSQPHVHALIFHNFVDTGTDRENIEHNFGILRSNLTPKLAWQRMSALNPALTKATDFEWIAGKTTDAPSVKEAFEAAIAPIYAIRFFVGENRWCTAIWTTSDKPQSTRIKPGSDAPLLEICDKQYGQEPRSQRPGADGQITLTLGAEPVYITQVSTTKPPALQISA
jgi:hypothetical protein